MTDTIDITCEISTKDRYHSTLPMAILSVAQQTYKPKKLLIFDDGEQKDLRQDSVYKPLFAMLSGKGIEWEVIFGERKGQVLNHQKAIQLAKTPFIWRLDDDDAPEPDCLEKLVSRIEPDVGAISGLILTPGDEHTFTSFASGKIEHVLDRPNVQWSRSEGLKEVDHFNNSFLFRVSAAQHGYCTELSPVGHREETLFTYGIKRAGFRLLFDPSAVIWHLRSPTGGIRSYADRFLWEHDEKIFLKKMEEYGVKFQRIKLVVLDVGLGDHFAFKMMLPELKEKYKDRDIVLAVCHPVIFKDDGVELISIAEAQSMCDTRPLSIYRFMWDNDWKDSIVNAYRKFLL